MQHSLTVLVPRVWPFLRHTISSVRRAALETLFTLLSRSEQVKIEEKFMIFVSSTVHTQVTSKNKGYFRTKVDCAALFQSCNYGTLSKVLFVYLFALQSCAMWINPILQDMLRHIFQSCILESNEEILEIIQKVCCTIHIFCVLCTCTLLLQLNVKCCCVTQVVQGGKKKHFKYLENQYNSIREK